MHNHCWRCGIHPALLATGLSRDEQPTSTDVVHLIYCSRFNLIKPAVWLSGSQVRGWIHRGAASYESQYRVICNRLWFLASLHNHQGAVTFHGLIITVRQRPWALLKRRRLVILSSLGGRCGLDRPQQALVSSLTIALANHGVHFELVKKLLAYFLILRWVYIGVGQHLVGA